MCAAAENYPPSLHPHLLRFRSHHAPGESSWDHPCDEYYRKLYETNKSKKKAGATKLKAAGGKKEMAEDGPSQTPGADGDEGASKYKPSVDATGKVQMQGDSIVLEEEIDPNYTPTESVVSGTRAPRPRVSEAGCKEQKRSASITSSERRGCQRGRRGRAPLEMSLRLPAWAWPWELR